MKKVTDFLKTKNGKIAIAALVAVVGVIVWKKTKKGRRTRY